MGTKRQSMTKSFTAQVLSRTRSSRKSTRAVDELLLVMLALDMFGLLRGEWRVGRSRLGSKNGGDNGTGRKPVKKALRLDFLNSGLYTFAPMESTLSRMMEVYSSG
jgi:hypothetical protein